MKIKRNYYSHIRMLFFIVVILVKTTACAETNGGDDLLAGEPSNLIVQVSVENETNLIINASANDAVHYQFLIVGSTEPIQVNTTGRFEHTFNRPGSYDIEVRAYGASGRFLREVVTVNINILTQGFTSPMHYDGYTLVWNDEFSGSAINTDYWVFEAGTGCPHLCGWGNDELQYYRSQNAWVDEGVLIIEARRENFGGRQFTSARMKTQGRQSFQYGRIDIRALLPIGQGMWPALWMLGDNITTVGWPRCGEIDIMEMVGGGGRENTVHGTVHWHTDRHVHAGGSYTMPSGIFADKYHVFSIVWDETHIRFMVNNIQYYVINITPEHMTEFHQRFFFIFNIAVGGRWPGSPDATTIFPQQMRVDYVRVFQRN